MDKCKQNIEWQISSEESGNWCASSILLYKYTFKEKFSNYLADIELISRPICHPNSDLNLNFSY